MKPKESEISLIVRHPENKYTEEEIMEMFSAWVKRKYAWLKLKEIKERRKD